MRKHFDTITSWGLSPGQEERRERALRPRMKYLTRLAIEAGIGLCALAVLTIAGVITWYLAISP